jgi:hypothetical protein
MRMGYFFFVTMLILGAGGCSSTSDDPEMRRRVAAVEILEQAPPDRQFTIVQEVRVTECDVESGKTQLRVEAAKLGADAVVSYVCTQKGIKCGLSVPTYQCSGDAVKWRS